MCIICLTASQYSTTVLDTVRFLSVFCDLLGWAILGDPTSLVMALLSTTWCLPLISLLLLCSHVTFCLNYYIIVLFHYYTLSLCSVCSLTLYCICTLCPSAPKDPRMTITVPDDVPLNSSSSITVTPTDVERNAAITLALYRSDNCSGNGVTMLDHAQLGNDAVSFPMTINTKNILGSGRLLDMMESDFRKLLPNISFTIGAMWADAIDQSMSSAKIFCSSPFTFCISSESVSNYQTFSSLHLPPTSEHALMYPMDLFANTGYSYLKYSFPLYVGQAESSALFCMIQSLLC